MWGGKSNHFFVPDRLDRPRRRRNAGENKGKMNDWSLKNFQIFLPLS
jgi:hypothetical protein